MRDFRACDWARELHVGQTDKAGKPYIQHIERVAAYHLHMFPRASLAEQDAAWLHDAMEDCGVTADDMRIRGYARETIDIVELVTRRPEDGLTYAQWIERIAASGNAGAMRVKIADLTDNMNPKRLAQLPPEKAASLSSRYARAFERLTGALEAHLSPGETARVRGFH